MNCGRDELGRASVNIDSGRAEAAQAGVKMAFHLYRCPAQLITSTFHRYPFPAHLSTSPCHRYRYPASLRMPRCYLVSFIMWESSFRCRTLLNTYILPTLAGILCWPGNGSSQTLVTSRSFFLFCDSPAAKSPVLLAMSVRTQVDSRQDRDPEDGGTRGGGALGSRSIRPGSTRGDGAKSSKRQRPQEQAVQEKVDTQDDSYSSYTWAYEDAEEEVPKEIAPRAE